MNRLLCFLAALGVITLYGRRARRINAVIASAWRTPIALPNRVTLADELEDIWN